MPNDMLDWGNERELVPLPDARYRVGEDRSADRVRFEAFFDDRAVRMVVDGAALTRAGA